MSNRIAGAGLEVPILNAAQRFGKGLDSSTLAAILTRVSQRKDTSMRKVLTVVPLLAATLLFILLFVLPVVVGGFLDTQDIPTHLWP